MHRLFLPEAPCVIHTQLEACSRLMSCAHRFRRKSLSIFDLAYSVATLLAAVILVVDDIDGGLVAVEDAVQDTGLVAVQNPVIGQDTADTQIDAGRDDNERAALVAVSGQDAAQKTAGIGLTNGSDSKNSGYASKLSNHFSLLLCLITPSGVVQLYN
ncbi:hypothetical protein AGR5A_Lc10248 [Agrobacterium genomosp. 5 str. CFBP 6626]|nr:hypothetical protein AGR5A_Lc10248 [Agrobacterium genomosp. 5 str. CFBP 6626]